MDKAAVPNTNYALKIAELRIDQIIISPTHSRRDLDGEQIQAHIAELAKSIEETGLLNPITIKFIDEQPHVAAGVLRLKACQQLGYKVIPCVIHESCTDPSILSLVENMQRDDLTAIEKAEAINRALAVPSLTQAELGAKIGLSNTTISDYKRVADMPVALKDLCRSNKDLPIRELKKVAVAAPEAQNSLLTQLINKYSSRVKAKNSSPRSNEATIKSAYAKFAKAIQNHAFANDAQKAEVLGELEAIFRKLIPQEEAGTTTIGQDVAPDPTPIAVTNDHDEDIVIDDDDEFISLDEDSEDDSEDEQDYD